MEPVCEARTVGFDELFLIAEHLKDPLKMRAVCQSWRDAADEELRVRGETPLRELMDALKVQLPGSSRLMVNAKTRRWLLVANCMKLTERQVMYRCASCGRRTSKILGCRCHHRTLCMNITPLSFPWIRALGGPGVVFAIVALLMASRK
jgi:hypothetical protein